MKNTIQFINTILLALLLIFICLIYFKLPKTITNGEWDEIRKAKDNEQRKKILDQLPYHYIDGYVGVYGTVDIDNINSRVEVEGEVECY